MTDHRYYSGDHPGYAGIDPDDDRYRPDQAWDYEPPYDLAEGASASDRWQTRRPIGDGRVRHLVYLDGRLVDGWVESSISGPWEAVARQLDREREHICRPAAPPPPPPPPRHEAIWEWLTQVVGDADLPTLTALPHPGPRPPTLTDVEAVAVHESVSGHLERVADAHFGPEIGRILADCLTTLWERAPETTLTRAPNLTAAGLCWVVGNANGLFGTGLITQTALARELWVKVPLAGPGKTISRVLSGVWVRGQGRVPSDCPKLMPFANPALLSSNTRRELIAWRDAARAAREEAIEAEALHEPDPVLPQQVE